MAGDPLGPQVVGQRVVVRRLLRGERGPSGGPAMTDVLGTCESWEAGMVVVRRDDGTLVRIPRRDVVAGKTVPPRPQRRPLAWDDEEADRLALPGWPPVESEPLGDWVLRASGGFSNRGNSVLALGDPGTALDRAVEEVEAWYAARSLEPRAHVHAGTDTTRAFEAAGWAAVTETVLMLAPVELPGAALETQVTVLMAHRVDDGWLETDERAARHGEPARQVLEGGEVAFATVRDDSGRVLSRGRASAHGDWVGISSLWTAPEHRSRGVGTAVVGALLGWGSERGATTAYLQVERANEVALRWYTALGFARHHDYVYYALGGRPQRTASPGE